MSIGNMLKTLEEEKEGTCYYRVLTPDGSLRWKCARYTYFGDDGSILLNVRDVHDIRIAQQQEENRFRAILRETCEYIIETDVETKSYTLHLPTLINRYPLADCSDYGSLIARYSERYVAPEDREAFLRAVSLPEALNRMRREGGSCSIKYTVNTNGSPAYKTWNMSLYRYDDNREYMLSYILDITKLVLEQQEKEREAERNRQIIKDALTAAEQASRAKSDFLSRMSHEIRTPMNVILGTLQLARSNPDDREKVAETLKKIGDASDHLLGLINDVLDVSRIESGKTEPEEQEFELEDMVESVTAMLRTVLGKRRQQLSVEIEDGIHMSVVGDQQRIRQILVNLLDNASKYTKEGGSIRLSLEELKKDQRDVRTYQFTVEDNGIGICPEDIARIFEPFCRVADSRISKEPGTGLGLTIVQNLVQMMNGEIRVASEPGKGSRFTVILYLTKSSGKHKAQTSVKIEPDEAFAGMKVLLVDDNELNQVIAKEMLEMLGAEVEVAANGQQAVEMIERNPEFYYELVFMDIQMPDMDGYEATRTIRASVHPDANSIPILAMTANAFAEDVQTALEAGMTAHVAKPIDLDVLQTTLKNALSQKLRLEERQQR